MILSKNNNVLKILVYIIFIGTLIGCDLRVSKVQLVGVYVTQLNYGQGILKLYPSGKCSLSFVYKKSKREVKATGQWKLDSNESTLLKESKVSLYGIFEIGSNLGAPYYGLRKGYIWILNADKSGDTIYLNYGPDTGRHFTKIGNIEQE